jgi:hypothetical protein
MSGELAIEAKAESPVRLGCMIDALASDVVPDPYEEAFCKKCKKSLCLRQKVVNYVLGHDEELFCLFCLGEQNQSGAAELVGNMREYILGRECFAKEWRKYPDRSYCPCPSRCIIEVCFGDEDG